MKSFLDDVLAVLYIAFPYACALIFAYLIGAFVEWSRDPETWSFSSRAIVSIWGLCFGWALDRRLVLNGGGL